MSAHDLNLAIVLRLNNQAGRGLHQVLTETQRDTRAVSREMDGLNRAASGTARNLSATAYQARNAERTLADASRAANSMTRNLASTNRETRSAVRNFAALARAEAQIRPTGMARLRSELTQVNALGRTAAGHLTTIGKGVAGAVAGGVVLNSVINKPVAYEDRLALLANTAYGDSDKKGRLAGIQVLGAGIRDAVNQGGGTPENALDTYSAMASSNAFGSNKEALKILPTILKAQKGSGAEGADLVNILAAAKQNLGIADKDLPAVLGKAIKAGQEGKFELPAMAKHLPEQMAKMASLGGKGMKNYEKLLAQNEVTAIVSGTQDAAGIDMLNLYNKLNAPDTQKDFARHGIDLESEFFKGTAKGIAPVDIFTGLIEKVSDKNKYKQLKEKLSKGNSEENQRALDAFLIQSDLGSLVQDSQAMTGLLGQTSQKEEKGRILGTVQKENGQETEISHSVMAEQIGYKKEQLANKGAFARLDGLDLVKDPLSKFLDTTNDLAERYPNLAVGALGVGASLTAIGGFNWLRGGLGSGAPAAIAGETTATAGGLSRLIPGPVGVGVGIMGAGYLIGNGINYISQGNQFGDMVDGLGQWIADLITNGIKIGVDVDVKNGNIVAAVNDANVKNGRRQ